MNNFILRRLPAINDAKVSIEVGKTIKMKITYDNGTVENVKFTENPLIPFVGNVNDKLKKELAEICECYYASALGSLDV